MLRATLLLMVFYLPGIASVLTFSAATSQYTDGDSPVFPPGFIVLPGFDTSFGTLDAVNLVSTFSLDDFIIEVGTDLEGADFSVTYAPTVEYWGPVPDTPPDNPPLFAPGEFGASFTLTATGVGTSFPGALCCDQTIGTDTAVIQVSGPAVTGSHDFGELDSFTSNPQVAFLTSGFFGVAMARLTGPTSGLGSVEYFAGSYTYTATITYTYNTPEPSSAIFLGTVLTVLAVARINLRVSRRSMVLPSPSQTG
ncbi:MAG TPA: hypothetical protein VKU19_07475 [Bryobacteraceae bacterium]|nr:hypothetical protein [Bryobacteraceae bacterium]